MNKAVQIGLLLVGSALVAKGLDSVRRRYSDEFREGRWPNTWHAGGGDGWSSHSLRQLIEETQVLRRLVDHDAIVGMPVLSLEGSHLGDVDGVFGYGAGHDAKWISV